MHATKRLALTSTVLVGALLLAACTSSSNEKALARPVGTPSPDTLAVSGNPILEMTPKRATLLTAGQAKDSLSAPWTFLGFPSATHDSVEVFFEIGDGCSSHLGFLVTSTDTTVTVLVANSYDFHAEVCVSVAKSGVAIVPLPRSIDPSVVLLHAPLSKLYAGSRHSD